MTKPSSTLPFRVGLSVFVPALVGTVLLPFRGGGSLLVGCRPCDAHVVAVDILPPTPCVEVTPTVCELGSEHLHIVNECSSTLSLTSAYFLTEGAVGLEGGTLGSRVTIPVLGFADLVAGPNAVAQNELSLAGTVDGTPISITIGVEVGDGGIDGGATFEGDGALGGVDAAGHADAHGSGAGGGLGSGG